MEGELKTMSIETAVYISIDRSKTLQEERTYGHNRWHPDITPAAEVEPGQVVGLETRDAFDGFIQRTTTAEDLQGANLGVDTYMSGTAAAAREAAILGRPAIAISQYVGKGKELDWELTEKRARMVISELLSKPAPVGAFWNINLPNPDNTEINLELVYCKVDPSPHGNTYDLEGDSFNYRDDYHNRARQPGRDIEICMGGRISISEIPLSS